MAGRAESAVARPTLRVVVCPDKFKGTLTAAEAAAAIADGIRQARGGGDRIDCVPLADGGEGTVQVALAAGGRPVAVQVTDPLGRPVAAVVAVLGDTVVAEVSSAAGLSHVTPSPATALAASSAGAARLVTAALDRGVRRIVLGLGGTATSDAGAGLATGLGVRLLDRRGQPIRGGATGLRDLVSIDLAGRDPRLSATRLSLACDVDVPLTGPHGAARMFAPQKGADPATVDLIEDALGTFADVLAAELGVDAGASPFAGAAGGLGLGAVALLGAEATAGATTLANLLGLPALLADCDLVITGEGSFDDQSRHGKLPQVVAALGTDAGATCVILAGRASAVPSVAGTRIRDLSEVEPDPVKRLSEAGRCLRQLARLEASTW